MTKKRKTRVLYDKILVEAIEIKERDGVLIPNSYEEKPEYGKVIQVGEGRLLDNGTRVPMSIEVGNRVWFNRYCSDKLNLDGKDYYVVKEEDVSYVEYD